MPVNEDPSGLLPEGKNMSAKCGVGVLRTCMRTTRVAMGRISAKAKARGRRRPGRMVDEPEQRRHATQDAPSRRVAAKTDRLPRRASWTTLAGVAPVSPPCIRSVLTATRLRVVLMHVLSLLLAVLPCVPVDAQTAPGGASEVLETASPSLDQLEGLARQVLSGGAEKDADRQRLCRQIKDRYLCNDEAVRSVPLKSWANLVPLVKDPGELAWWGNRIRLAFVEDAGQIGRTSPQDFQRLSQILTGTIGKPFADQAVARWVEDGDAWRSLEGQDLVGLAISLKAVGESARPARARLMERIASRYLGNAATTRELGPVFWSDVVTNLGTDHLSPEARMIWTAKLREAFVSNPGALQSLAPGDVLRLVRAVGLLSGKKTSKQLLSSWGQTVSLDSLGPGDLEYLAVSAGLDKENGEAVRARLREYLDGKYIRRGGAEDISIRTWHSVAGGDMNGQRRSQWAARIQAAFAEDVGVLRSLAQEDVFYLTRCMWRLAGDAPASAVLTAWMDAAEPWTNMDSAGLVYIVNSLIVGREAGATEIPRQRLQAHRHECIGTILEPFTTPQQVGKLSNGDMTGIARAIEALDDGETAYLVRTQWRLCQDMLSTAAEATSRNDLIAVSIRLLLRKVQWAPQDARAQLWRDGFATVRGIVGQCGWGTSLAKDVLDDLDVFLESRDAQIAQEVLRDLASISSGGERQAVLDRWLSGQLANMTFPEGSAAGQDVRKAITSETQSQPEEAARSYTAAIAQCPDQEPAAQLMRIRLAELLLEGADTDLLKAQTLVQEIKPDEDWQRELTWNLTCRLALKKTASCPEDQRDRTWKAELNRLSVVQSDPILHQATLAELDTCFATLDKASQGSMADGILADLLLLAPQTESMRQLQSRRIDRFVASKTWEEAIPAARMGVMLAVTSSEGPRQAVKRCSGIMASAGMSAEQCRRFEISAVYPSPPEAAGGQEGKDHSGPAADSVLLEQAKALLAQGREQLSPRRRAFACALTGEDVSSLKDIHQAWVTAVAGGDPRRAAEALDDIAVILAVRGKTVRGCDRFAALLAALVDGSALPATQPATEGADPAVTTLAGCLRRGIEEKTISMRQLAPGKTDGNLSAMAGSDFQGLSLWSRRLLTWATAALSDDDILWAEGLRSWAASSARRPSRLASVFDNAYLRIKPDYGQEDSIAGMLAVAGEIPQEPRRQLLPRIAQFQYSLGRFQPCLDSLAQAGVLDGDKTSPDQGGDVEARLLGVVCCLKLGEHSRALELLRDMQQWTVTDRQQACMLALEGLVCLDQRQKAKALPALRTLIDRHPDAPVTAAATRIVRRLDSLP